MRARSKGLALGIAADEVRRRRKPFEVFGFKAGFTVSRFKQAIRLRPRLCGECVPGSNERLAVCHLSSLKHGRTWRQPWLTFSDASAARPD